MFTEDWFARRHTATKPALETARAITKNSAPDPTEFVKRMIDWQRYSMARSAEGFHEWPDLCTVCAGHFANAVMVAEKEGLKETAKRTDAIAKSKHAMPV